MSGITSITAGALNRKLVIEKRSGAKDGLNQPLDDWSPFKSDVWGRWIAQSGYAAIASSNGGVERSPVQGVWRVRYATAITDDMRVNFKGVIFDIVQVRHDHDRRDFTDLVCSQGGNNG